MCIEVLRTIPSSVSMTIITLWCSYIGVIPVYGLRYWHSKWLRDLLMITKTAIDLELELKLLFLIQWFTSSCTFSLFWWEIQMIVFWIIYKRLSEEIKTIKDNNLTANDIHMYSCLYICICIYMYFCSCISRVVINSHFSSYDPLIPRVSSDLECSLWLKVVIMTVLHINLTCDACENDLWVPMLCHLEIALTENVPLHYPDCATCLGFLNCDRSTFIGFNLSNT